MVIYFPEAQSQTNIVAAKIKPKPVCLMASDKQACVQLYHPAVGLARLPTQDFITCL
jgi:hypothetical protein